VTRLVGTSIFRASSAALISSASSSSAKCSPGWIAVSALAMLLVIVDNLHVQWPRRSASPLEANPPLIVNADAVLALAVAYQRFKTVPGNAARSLSDVAASIRSSFRRADCSNPENALTPSLSQLSGRGQASGIFPVRQRTL
jgi:hypothetical protein